MILCRVASSFFRIKPTSNNDVFQPYRNNVHVKRHAKKYLERMDAGEDIFRGLKEYKDDFAEVSSKRTRTARAGLLTSPIRTSRTRATRVSLSPPKSRRVINSGTWSIKEERLFNEGLRKYGHGKWEAIATLVKTR